MERAIMKIEYTKTESFDSPHHLPVGSIIAVTFRNKNPRHRLTYRERATGMKDTRVVYYLKCSNYHENKSKTKIKWVNTATGAFMGKGWPDRIARHPKFVGWKVERKGKK